LDVEMSASTRTSGDPAQRVTAPGRPNARVKPVPLPSVIDEKSEAGAVIAGYVVEGVVGEGGMGRVLRARDPNLDRVVALKILVPDDEEARGRFLREAQALGRVDHPHVVRAFASGEDGELVWTALELIDGEPLSELMRREQLDEETALSLAAQTARGLEAVHAVGIIHRDVKPENLLLDDTGLLRIVDFGVALVEGARGGFRTSAGVAVGTPHFMTPEQARGDSLDERVDTWGLGATLYTLLAGVPPFYREDDEPDLEILARVLREPAPDVRERASTVGEETAKTIARMLAADREDRPADLGRLAGQLEMLADDAMLRAERGEVVEYAADPPGPATNLSDSSTEALDADAGGDLTRAALVAVLGLAVVIAGVLGLMGALDEKPAEPTPPPLAETPEPPTIPAPPPEPPEPEPGIGEATPTAELLAAIVSGSPDGMTALDLLLERQGDEVTEALRTVVTGSEPAARALLERLDDKGARAHVDVVEAALFEGQGAVPIAAVSLLERARNVRALGALSRAERTHPNKAVRKAARRARATIFKFDQ
jgi:serine/threonine-protein kinase